MNKKNIMPPRSPLPAHRVEGAGKDAAKINRSLVTPVEKVVPKDDLSGWFYSR